MRRCQEERGERRRWQVRVYIPGGGRCCQEDKCDDARRKMTSTSRKALAAAAIALALLGVAEGQGKPGSCSPPSAIGVCAFICRSDFDCSGPNKCCPTACGGTVCSKPITMRVRPGAKQGSCPSSPGGPWVCSNRCSVDTDCRGNLKCCKNRCGAFACQRPVP